MRSVILISIIFFTSCNVEKQSSDVFSEYSNNSSEFGNYSHMNLRNDSKSLKSLNSHFKNRKDEIEDFITLEIIGSEGEGYNGFILVKFDKGCFLYVLDKDLLSIIDLSDQKYKTINNRIKMFNSYEDDFSYTASKGAPFLVFSKFNKETGLKRFCTLNYLSFVFPEMEKKYFDSEGKKLRHKLVKDLKSECRKLIKGVKRQRVVR